MFLSSRLQDQYGNNRAMRFPLLFAVPTDDSRDRVSIYQATLLREGPDRWGDSPSVYLVAPYRIFHGHDDAQWPDEAFVRTRDPRVADERPNHDVLLVADYPSRPAYFGEEATATPWVTGPTATPWVTGPTVTPDRRPLYRGTWRHDAATVFSMYCSAAIPILRFNGHGYLSQWPSARFNRLPLTRASMDLVRAWARRWDPRGWTDDAAAAAGYNSSDSEEEAVPALVPVLLPPRAVAAPAVAAPVATAPVAAPLPLFVTAALIADARNRNLACPITLEPINPDTAAVTPCYHVFDADALSVWVAQQLAHDGATAATCPVCKLRI